MILISAATTTIINGNEMSTTSIIARTTRDRSSDRYEISLVLLLVVTIQW